MLGERRRTIFLILSLLIVAAMLVSACGGGDSEQEAADASQEEAAPAAAESEAETKEEDSKEAMMEVDLSPGEYPEPHLIVGSREVQKLPLDQILIYKALDSYSEPDWVSELVADGVLPPVEERLPIEPRVILESGMADGIGVYGGV